MSRALVLLLAVACGVIVANTYYAQPLLPTIAADFQLPEGLAGLSTTVPQFGYAAGLVLLVPLGDLLANRALITVLLGINVLALAATALATGPGPLWAALAVVGMTGSTISVLISLAAALAGQHQRGRVVGALMTGLLLGVLLARTVSGALAQLAGWRSVYACAAVAVAGLAVALRLCLPNPPASPGTSYARLLTSTVGLVRTEPFLRRRMVSGALCFAAFHLFWTALPFLLSAPPHAYPTAVIGLFGLAGAAGALAAQPIGRLQDRGLARPATAALLLATGLAWALTGAGGHLLVALLAGILLLDVGVQGVHVLNQAAIYGYPASVRSRVTTAYMSAYFCGGTAGSGLAVPLYDRAGWLGVCAAGALLAVCAAALWLTDRVPGPTAVPTHHHTTTH